jgi:cytochrome c553
MKQDSPSRGTDPRPVDESFDPWEQTRPIPLFVIALVFALTLWGLSTYLSDYLGELQRHARPAPPPAAAASIEVARTPGVASPDGDIMLLVGAGKGQAWSCASCHGAAGQGNLSTPRLAGQPADYLRKQLQDFASGQRHNESMALVARALRPDEMDKLARYYAGIELAAAPRPSLGGDLARGKALAEQGDWKLNVPACFSCHGTGGEGVAPGFPALAGQQPDYLFAQLAAWHAGERKNSPQQLMDGIAQRMSPQDMRSVADYLGSLAPHRAPSAPEGEH